MLSAKTALKQCAHLVHYYCSSEEFCTSSFKVLCEGKRESKRGSGFDSRELRT